MSQVAHVQVTDAAKVMLDANEEFLRRVIRAIRPLIPKESGMNGTLTLLVRGGRLRADFTSQVREDGWTDASR